MMLGSALGVGLALVREQMDETITDPSDLEKIRPALLGAIPKSRDDPISEVRDPKSKCWKPISRSRPASLSRPTTASQDADRDHTRPAKQDDHRLRHRLYARARRRADPAGRCRHASPSLHADLGLPNTHGRSNYLSGGDNIVELIQKPAGNPFEIMTAGPQPPNAAELLRGNRLETLLAQLSARYDHVVIDSPPVMGLSDAPIIASHTDGTLFVVEARGVKARMAELAIGRLRQARAHLLGTVLTKFDSRRAHFGYGYEYGYGYGSSKSA